ncbi:MAG: hypothetical protein AAFQ37_12855, partial [Bacteroidota bacterium]
PFNTYSLTVFSKRISSLNSKGDFDRNSLFHTRDLELKLRFRDGVQVATNEVIIPSERRNRLRLVTLTY